MVRDKLRSPRKAASSAHLALHEHSSSPTKGSSFFSKKRNRSSCMLCTDSSPKKTAPNSRISDPQYAAHAFLDTEKLESQYPTIRGLKDLSVDKWQAETVQHMPTLKRRKSWFKLTPKRTSKDSDDHSLKMSSTDGCVVEIDACLTGEHRVIGSGEVNMLVSLSLKGIIREHDRNMDTDDPLDDSPLKSVVIVLDPATAWLNKGQILDIKNICSSLLHLLLPQDCVSILVNRAGSDRSRVIAQSSGFLSLARNELLCAIHSYDFVPAKLERDFLSTISQAASMLATRKSGTKAVMFFISDGIFTLNSDTLQAMRCILHSHRINMYTLGAGVVVNEDNLRLLAHGSARGSFLHASNSNLVLLLRIINRGIRVAPLTDVRVDLKSFGDATIVKAKRTLFEAAFASPKEVSLTIPRIGVYETWQIIFVLSLPAQDILQLNTSTTRETTTSSRLAELENMVRAMPFKLLECSLSYKHPMLAINSRVLQSVEDLSIRRLSNLNQQEMHGNRDVIELDLQQEILELLMVAERAQLVYDVRGSLKALVEAENTLLAYLIRAKSPSKRLENTFTFVSARRYQLSPSRVVSKESEGKSAQHPQSCAGTETFNSNHGNDNVISSTFYRGSRCKLPGSKKSTQDLPLVNTSFPQAETQVQPQHCWRDRAREIWQSLREERGTSENVFSLDKGSIRVEGSRDQPSASRHPKLDDGSQKVVKFRDEVREGKPAKDTQPEVVSLSTYSTTPGSGNVPSLTSSKWAAYIPDNELLRGISLADDNSEASIMAMRSRASSRSAMTPRRPRSI